jgi:transposase
MNHPTRNPYPSDATDEDWVFVAPYLTLMTEDAPQRRHELREVFNALCWIVRTGAPWRDLPTNLPPWAAVHQQAQRGIAAGCFEDMVDDLRVLLREASGRNPAPTAVVLDARTLRGTAESGHRAGYDGHKRTNDSKIHAAVDTLGYLLALRVTPANAQERAQVGDLADAVQETTGNTVELAWVDQGYTGDDPVEAAEARGIEVIVVRLPEAKKGFVLLPRRWVVAPSFAWATRFRRLAKDYERLPETVAGLHFLAFACLMLHNLLPPPSATP